MDKGRVSYYDLLGALGNYNPQVITQALVNGEVRMIVRIVHPDSKNKSNRSVSLFFDEETKLLISIHNFSSRSIDSVYLALGLDPNFRWEEPKEVIKKETTNRETTKRLPKTNKNYKDFDLNIWQERARAFFGLKTNIPFKVYDYVGLGSEYFFSIIRWEKNLFHFYESIDGSLIKLKPQYTGFVFYPLSLIEDKEVENLIIVEGEKDADTINSSQEEGLFAVSLKNISLSSSELELSLKYLKGKAKTIIFSPDNDFAGLKYAYKLLTKLIDLGFPRENLFVDNIFKTGEVKDDITDLVGNPKFYHLFDRRSKQDKPSFSYYY